MIGFVSVIAGGLIAGLLTPLFSPVLYLISRYSRTAFLIGFAVYCISLGYEFSVQNIYTQDLTFLLTIIIPSILMLDSGLKRTSSTRIDYGLAAAMIAGLAIGEIFMISVVFALINQFSDYWPRKRSVIVALSGISVLFGSLMLARGSLDVLGGASTQAAFISAVTVLWAVALLIWLGIAPGNE